MTGRLEKLAKDLKISAFGAIEARVFDDLCLDLRKSTGSEPPPETYNPFLTMPEAKSIIVCLFSYNTKEKGNISKYAMGCDYHSVIKKKLEAFTAPLIESGYSCMPFSDSWSMNERFLAVLAGLGFIGKNHMLIHPKFGSFVFIGTVLTDCPLPESKPLDMSCKSCGKCISACPGKALSENLFDETKCVSYITQKKGELTESETAAMLKSGYIWGCDICQTVCPHNIAAPISEIEEFSDNLILNLHVDENLSNREFKRLYFGRAFTWRGISPILRNQKIFEKYNKN